MIGTLGPYEQKRQRLAAELSAVADGRVRLAKDTSNLFRDRRRKPSRRLDVRGFNQVLEVHPQRGWVEAEGMTTYDDLVSSTLMQGVMPCVVPQLKSITIGGAVSGIGIESTSFRYGLVHETIVEMDVLTGTGTVVTCDRNNEHRDLFFGLPNSYGTLGYVLKLKAQTVPVKPYVRLQHIHHDEPERFFCELEQFCTQEIDFLDGVVFDKGKLAICVGRFVDEAPYTSDYTYENIYYRSIPRRDEDYLTVADYLWRWDTDWFWCSKSVGAQNPVLRRLYGRKRLNSVFYTRLMRRNAKWRITGSVNRLLGVHTESVIQDVDIPIDRAPEFLEFFHREIGIKPLWICPIGMHDPAARFPLYPLDPRAIYVNFGFWDVVRDRDRRPAGHYNRLIEDKVEELSGVKSLYSDAYYEPDRFWRLYNRSAYDSLKSVYDPDNRFGNLYEKCVLRQ